MGIDKQRLSDKAAAMGISISGSLADQLARYAELLVSYNEKVNLTALTAPQDIEEKHFLDCLAFAALPEVKEGHSLVDVGTGAGFPGVVAKLYKPGVALSLMDPTGKRLEFLRFLCGELGIEAAFIKERGEEAARKQWRETFDIATARAVAALPALAEYCLPLVKVGGVFLPMKGPGEAPEDAAAAAKALGAKYEKTHSYLLPGGEERRVFVFRKTASTPAVYPRAGGKIAKKPL